MDAVFDLRKSSRQSSVNIGIWKNCHAVRVGVDASNLGMSCIIGALSVRKVGVPFNTYVSILTPVSST